MSLSIFLGRIIEILQNLKVPYMVTGSLAASYHGAPRATQDVDVVIEVTDSQADGLVQAFEADGHYVSKEAAHQAVRARGQFNVIDPTTGWKLDLIVCKARPFSRVEFERRREVEVLDCPLFMVSAEDLVIAKLEWARLGESERQLRDVVGILEVQGEALDQAYLRRWIEELGLEEAWQSVSGERGDDRREDGHEQ